MSWGRTTIAGPATNGTDGAVGGANEQQQMSERRLVNILATGSVDQVSARTNVQFGEMDECELNLFSLLALQTVKIWLP